MRPLLLCQGAPLPARPDPRLFGLKTVALHGLLACGLPTPPAVAVSFEAVESLAAGVAEADALVREALSLLESASGARLDDPSAPLLLAVRGAGEADRPGEVGTALGVGATPPVLATLRRELGERAALEVRRRHLQALGHWVGRRSHHTLRGPLRRARREHAARLGLGAYESDDSLERRWPDFALPTPLLEEVVRSLEELSTWGDGPEPRTADAVVATARAIALDARERRVGKVALVLQVLAHAHLDARSGSGVIASRSLDGEPVALVEWRAGAHGDDLLSGRAPAPLEPIPPLAEVAPEAAAELAKAARALEAREGWPVDVEFTVDRGRAWLLEQRPSRLSPRGVARAAVELVRSGALEPQAALARVDALALRELTRRELTGDAVERAFARGVGASPGLVMGRVYVDPEAAVTAAARGEPVVLARPDPSVEEVPAMRVAAAIVTARGGLTCHAAVIARSLGRAAVVSCGALEVDERAKTVRAGGVVLREGEWLTVDGALGALVAGRADTQPVEAPAELDELLALADAVRGVPLFLEGVTSPDDWRGAAGVVVTSVADAERLLSLGSSAPARIAWRLGGLAAGEALHLLAQHRIPLSTMVLITAGAPAAGAEVWADSEGSGPWLATEPTTDAGWDAVARAGGGVVTSAAERDRLRLAGARARASQGRQG
jgi:pyruvate,orthophosphate dikinase